MSRPLLADEPSSRPGGQQHHSDESTTPRLLATDSAPLTLLTWDEYRAMNGSGNQLGLAVDEPYGGGGGDGFDSDEDEEFGSDMSDDDMVPASLWKATCVPTFALDSSDSSSLATESWSSPSMPSSTLEECINTPTFALVPRHAVLNHRASAVTTPEYAVWREDDARIPSSAPLPTSPKPTSISRKGRPPKSQAHRRKRKNSPNDEYNAAAGAKLVQPSIVKRPVGGKRKEPRHPLQPKVPNAPVNEVPRGVTA